MSNAKTIAAEWLRKWYVICAILIIMFGVGVRCYTSPLPDPISIPSPAMPSPNARDTFTAAEILLKDGGLVDYAISPPLKGPVPSGFSAADPNSGYHTFTLAEKEQLIRENQPALDKMREGLREAYMSPPVRSFDTLIPYFAKDRAMARLIQLQEKVDIQRGDWNGAMTSCLDNIQLGTDLPHGSALIGMLVGIACDAIGRRPIHESDVIDHLTSAQAKAAANRLAQIVDNEVSLATVLQNQKWFMQASILQLFSKSTWRSDLISLAPANQTPSESELPEIIQIYTTSRRQYFQRYTDYMNAEVAYVKMPWPDQLSTPPPFKPHDVLSDVIVSDFKPVDFRFLSTVALDRLLELQLALRAYKLDKGSYPSRLNQLAPQYIPAVPMDPYSNNQELLYKSAGSTYILYSIGPDGVDDGGKPIDNTGYWVNMSGWNIHNPTLNPDAKGDIVAGVNY
jgi:hypothetical protein